MKILVVSPHPDDETLGCGGTLLKHKAAGDTIHWLIVTGMHLNIGYTSQQIEKRKQEIELVTQAYGFSSVHNLNLPTTRLDTIAMSDLVKMVSDVFDEIKPTQVYMPFRGDIHTDHTVVFNMVASCSKWFRHDSIRKLLAYETLSETEFGLNPEGCGFSPTTFVDISNFLKKKIQILRIYDGEIKTFPFPRSEQAVEALAKWRGATIGSFAAEAFVMLRESIK